MIGSGVRPDDEQRARAIVADHLNCCWAVLMDDSGAYLDDSDRLRAVRAALGDFREAMLLLDIDIYKAARA